MYTSSAKAGLVCMPTLPWSTTPASVSRTIAQRGALARGPARKR